MRSLVLPYKSSFALSEVMHGSPDATLPVPEGAHVGDGEWVVAVVEVAEGRRSSAAAAVGRRSERGLVVAFGALDWERIGGLTAPSSSRPGSVSRVPVAPAELATDEDAPPSSLRTPGVRVAVVDDDAATRDELRSTLRAQGLDVVAFATCAEALAEPGPLHAAVVSYGLAGEGAKAFARKIREKRPSGVPVLFVSGQRCSREVVEAYASGCDDYLARPFRGAELGARVLGLLRRSLDAYR